MRENETEERQSDITMTATEMARGLVARKMRVAGQCAVCGKAIEGIVKHGMIARLYCSERCRKTAYRARRKAAGS